VRELRGQLQRTRDVEGVVRVVLRGDGNSPYRNVAAVLNACRDEGVDELGMSVRLASRIRE
jgi:biopolymer transport protein ExbD